jgi:hypothetical protein
VRADRQRWPSGLAHFFAFAALAATALSAPLAAGDSLVTRRGAVRCLDAFATPADRTEDPCNQPGASFELQDESGAVLAFRADDPRAEIFLDPRVRAMQIEVRGWLRPGETIEILSVYSIHGGRRHHLHYRCDVCDITATAPGPCWCCGADFELREEAVDEASTP